MEHICASGPNIEDLHLLNDTPREVEMSLDLTAQDGDSDPTISHDL